MKKIIIISFLLFTFGYSNAEMVLNSEIGNDPAKEKLCASRVKSGGKMYPFMIDSDFVARVRAVYPDVTFISMRGQLYQCQLIEGTGKYGPGLSMPENSNIWHSIEHKGFEPGIDTRKGKDMAYNVCFEAFKAKCKRSGFDHEVINDVREVVEDTTIKSKKRRPNDLFAGKKATYDIIVEGTSLYGPANPDLTAVHFNCLLSPTLEVKAIQFK
jgi:hypothetical protein